MKIKITTHVKKSLEEVFAGFDEKLFLKLAPPFPLLKLLRFDGCKKNDEVHIELSFLFFKQKWISLITDFEKNNDEIFFIDEGKKLPFFLKKWKHKHILKRHTKNSTLIIDDIEFETPVSLTKFAIWPAIYLQFLYRKPIYKKYFSK